MYVSYIYLSRKLNATARARERKRWAKKTEKNQHRVIEILLQFYLPYMRMHNNHNGNARVVCTLVLFTFITNIFIYRCMCIYRHRNSSVCVCMCVCRNTARVSKTVILVYNSLKFTKRKTNLKKICALLIVVNTQCMYLVVYFHRSIIDLFSCLSCLPFLSCCNLQLQSFFVFWLQSIFDAKYLKHQTSADMRMYGIFTLWAQFHLHIKQIFVHCMFCRFIYFFLASVALSDVLSSAHIFDLFAK